MWTVSIEWANHVSPHGWKGNFLTSLTAIVINFLLLPALSCIVVAEWLYSSRCIWKQDFVPLKSSRSHLLLSGCPYMQMTLGFIFFHYYCYYFSIFASHKSVTAHSTGKYFPSLRLFAAVVTCAISLLAAGDFRLCLLVIRWRNFKKLMWCSDSSFTSLRPHSI